MSSYSGISVGSAESSYDGFETLKSEEPCKHESEHARKWYDEYLEEDGNIGEQLSRYGDKGFKYIQGKKFLNKSDILHRLNQCVKIKEQVEEILKYQENYIEYQGNNDWGVGSRDAEEKRNFSIEAYLEESVATTEKQMSSSSNSQNYKIKFDFSKYVKFIKYCTLWCINVKRKSNNLYTYSRIVVAMLTMFPQCLLIAYHAMKKMRPIKPTLVVNLQMMLYMLELISKGDKNPNFEPMWSMTQKYLDLTNLKPLETYTAYTVGEKEILLAESFYNEIQDVTSDKLKWTDIYKIIREGIIDMFVFGCVEFDLGINCDITQVEKTSIKWLETMNSIDEGESRQESLVNKCKQMNTMGKFLETSNNKNASNTKINKKLLYQFDKLKRTKDMDKYMQQTFHDDVIPYKNERYNMQELVITKEKVLEYIDRESFGDNICLILVCEDEQFVTIKNKIFLIKDKWNKAMNSVLPTATDMSIINRSIHSSSIDGSRLNEDAGNIEEKKTERTQESIYKENIGKTTATLKEDNSGKERKKQPQSERSTKVHSDKIDRRIVYSMTWLTLINCLTISEAITRSATKLASNVMTKQYTIMKNKRSKKIFWFMMSTMMLMHNSNMTNKINFEGDDTFERIEVYRDIHSQSINDKGFIVNTKNRALSKALHNVKTISKEYSVNGINGIDVDTNMNGMIIEQTHSYKQLFNYIVNTDKNAHSNTVFRYKLDLFHGHMISKTFSREAVEKIIDSTVYEKAIGFSKQVMSICIDSNCNTRIVPKLMYVGKYDIANLNSFIFCEHKNDKDNYNEKQIKNIYSHECTISNVKEYKDNDKYIIEDGSYNGLNIYEDTLLHINDFNKIRGNLEIIDYVDICTPFMKSIHKTVIKLDKRSLEREIKNGKMVEGILKQMNIKSNLISNLVSDFCYIKSINELIRRKYGILNNDFNREIQGVDWIVPYVKGFKQSNENKEILKNNNESRNNSIDTVNTDNDYWEYIDDTYEMNNNENMNVIEEINIDGKNYKTIHKNKANINFNKDYIQYRNGTLDRDVYSIILNRLLINNELKEYNDAISSNHLEAVNEHVEKMNWWTETTQIAATIVFILNLGTNGGITEAIGIISLCIEYTIVMMWLWLCRRTYREIKKISVEYIEHIECKENGAVNKTYFISAITNNSIRWYKKWVLIANTDLRKIAVLLVNIIVGIIEIIINTIPMALILMTCMAKMNMNICVQKYEYERIKTYSNVKLKDMEIPMTSILMYGETDICVHKIPSDYNAVLTLMIVGLLIDLVIIIRRIYREQKSLETVIIKD